MIRERDCRVQVLAHGSYIEQRVLVLDPATGLRVCEGKRVVREWHD